MFRILETITSIRVLRGLPKHLKQNIFGNRIPFICGLRGYSDEPVSDSKKIVVKVQGTETDHRLRVRLARPSDTPRVLRFVRDHARVWPGPLAPPSNLIVGDYVARTLAQGHSMIAEQQPNSSRSEVLGLALAAAVCPWDPDVLERWARCVKCTRSRRLLNFTAHCLRAPRLHDTYGVQSILQVVLIVPPDTPKSAEIISVLAKNAIKRGKEAGYPLVRFDVTTESDEKSLEELNLKKEWFVSYKIINFSQIENSKGSATNTISDEASNDSSGNFVSVYTSRITPGRSLSK